MKKAICVFLFGVLLSTHTLAQQTVFTNVHVIPMDQNKVLENQTVVILGDRIQQIGPAGEVEVPAGAKIIEGEGKYLMPGLAEMHGHVPPSEPGPNAPSYFNDEYIKSTLFLYLSAGITTVRGMLGYEGQLELKDKVNAGMLIGPNLYLAGPSFNGNSVSSPAQAREMVKAQVAEGWDLLKVHPGLSRAEYDAMAETAHDLEIDFGGHVPEAVGLIHALNTGQKTIDHIDGYVAYLNSYEGAEREDRLKEVVQMTKEKGVWIVPTQALWETIIGAADYERMKAYDELKYIPKPVVQNYLNFVDNLENNTYYDPTDVDAHAELRRRLLEEMNSAGVKILMGTDAPQLFSVPGFSIHRELPHMVAAGMTPYEIIESGTRNVGEYFSDKDSFGVIAEGNRADLILVNQNPLEAVSNIQDHSGVMVQGLWYSREMIDLKLKEIEDYYSGN